MNSASQVLHPIAISQVIVNFAAEHGVDKETCLLGTDISEQQLHDADAYITREQEMRLIENVMLALPDLPAPGFELGLRYNVSTFGIWGFALRTSRNLREAVQRALRYLPLSTAYCRFNVVENANGFGISANADTIPQHLRQFLLERDMATGINLLNELGLAGIHIETLQLQGPIPEYADRIAELCGITPQYQSEHNVLMMAVADADKPLPTYDAHLVRLFEDQCRAQLQRRQNTGMSGLVREQILGPLGMTASLEEVADKLSMSPRNLRRKLDGENTSFRALLEHERKHLADQLLTSTQMKLDELALHLGYADTASFTRAFRRWFEVSPGQYRNRAQSQ